MPFVVMVIGVLVFSLVFSESRRLWQAHSLRQKHLASLFRLGDQVRASLPELAGELVSAAIDEEIDEAS